jgi:hypothetical protein
MQCTKLRWPRKTTAQALHIRVFPSHLSPARELDSPLRVEKVGWVVDEQGGIAARMREVLGLDSSHLEAISPRVFRFSPRQALRSLCRWPK